MMGNESKSARSCVVEEFARLTQERDEAMATIETLRQRVRELEGERDRWKSAHHEMVNRNKLLRDRPDLPIERLQAYQQITAENAELKRQVEAMREDAEVGQRLWKFLCQNQHLTIRFVSCMTESMKLAIGIKIGDDYQGWHDTPIEALREAAKGGVEG